MMKSLVSFFFALALSLQPAVADISVGPASPLMGQVTVTGPAAQSVLNTDLLTGTVNGWYDVSAFKSGSIQIIGSAGITAGNVMFEMTNDTTLAPSGVGMQVMEPVTASIVSNGAVSAITASTVRVFSFQVNAKFIRVRVSTAFTGGTVQAVASFSQVPYYSPFNQTLAQATIALIGDVGQQYRATATGAAAIFAMMSPATPVATAIKASPGRVIGYDFQNSAATLRSFKCANIAAGSVVLGTTAGVFEVDIPAGIRASHSFEGGLGFTTAITCWVTGAKGLTDNTAITVNDVTGFIAYQ